MTAIPHTLTVPRVPPAWRLLIVGTILVCGTVTLPQRVGFGGVSGLGALTIVWCLAAWGLWAPRPWLPGELRGPLLPLVLFTICTLGSMLWYPPAVKGLQVVAVGVGFLGLLLLTGRHVEESRELAAAIHRALDVAAAFSAVVYATSTVFFGMGAEDFILARPFALFAMLGVARQLSRWQAGERGGLLFASLLTAAVFLSVSRTALVACLALFPLAAMIRGDRRSVVATAWFTAVAAAALLAAVFLSDTMYERFFGFDATLTVGGVNINASGRRAMWELLVERSWDHPLFGHGIGASSVLVDNTFVNLGHPHNDFLRFLYDLGLVGLGLWLVFLGLTCLYLWPRAVRLARRNDPRLPYVLTPLLALLAVSASMFTDNSAGYVFVMAPLGILLGCAFGVLRRGVE